MSGFTELCGHAAGHLSGLHHVVWAVHPCELLLRLHQNDDVAVSSGTPP